MFYACTIDPSNGLLYTADEFGTQQEARAFVLEELYPSFSGMEIAILTREDYLEVKERI